MTSKISGPFGSYDWGTAGAILNSLCKHYNIPLPTVERLRIDKGELTENDKLFANYKWIEGIERPLFRFSDYVTYGRQNRFVEGKPKFHLELYVHNNPGFVVSEFRDKKLFTPELWQFVDRMMSANISHMSEHPSEYEKKEHEMYQLRQAAGAFFQGGASGPDQKFIYIEFWKPEGAQAFVDYINENFRYKSMCPA